jgi:prepilin-type N-terminal cleavage/methylation domain-containing protein
MSTLKRIDVKSAFTLLEVLIAVSISAVILLGAYSMFNGVLAASSHTQRSGDRFTEVQAFERLILRDMRMMLRYGFADNQTLSPEDVFFSMVSQNSLTFNKSIPVGITYFLKDGSIYREEKVADMDYLMQMPLLSAVSSAKVEGYDGRDYSDTLSGNTAIFRFTFVMDNATYSFTAARLLGNIGE